MPTLSRKVRRESVCIRVESGFSIHIEKLGGVHDGMTEVAESKAIGLCGAIWDVSVSVLPNPIGGNCFEQCNSSHCFLRSGRTTECQLICLLYTSDAADE